MLISHKYKFIFIKTTKTAGTSIEIELSKFLGESDIVTPIFPKEDNHKPKNYRNYLGKIVPKNLHKYIPKKMISTYYNHIPAKYVKNNLGEERFNSYYKFCIEREPIDKCISHYSMLKNSPYHKNNSKTLSWERYIDMKKFPYDHNKYLDNNGNLIVDKIIRFENLSDELEKVCRKLKLPFKKLKSKAKSGFRDSIIPSRSDKKIIYDSFSKSLKFTEYKLID